MGTDRIIVSNADSFARQQVKAGTATTMQVLISPNDAPNFALRRFCMEPGGGMPNHINKVEHEQFVLKGKATIGIGDKTFSVTAGDVIYIPAGVPHWYRAEGKEPFEFLCAVPNVPDEIEILD